MRLPPPLSASQQGPALVIIRIHMVYIEDVLGDST
jgi:hypothetical protein